MQSEVWQAREAGNPEENESVKQWLLPALATSSAAVGEGSDSWHLGQPEFRSLVISAWSICKTHACVCILHGTEVPEYEGRLGEYSSALGRTQE